MIWFFFCHFCCLFFFLHKFCLYILSCFFLSLLQISFQISATFFWIFLTHVSHFAFFCWTSSWYLFERKCGSSRVGKQQEYQSGLKNASSDSSILILGNIEKIVMSERTVLCASMAHLSWRYSNIQNLWRWGEWCDGDFWDKVSVKTLLGWKWGGTYVHLWWKNLWSIAPHT